MYCCICKKVPKEPVVSKKTGHLFEKRLITKYIQENSTCPISQLPLTMDDLLEVISTVKSPNEAPKSISTTSIPQMLEMFQNEWDHLMLETFSTRKKLDTARQELSHSLYQHDAACRVIARLLKTNEHKKTGDRMDTDDKEYHNLLKRDIIINMDKCASMLSQKRKNRKLSQTLKRPENLSKISLSMTSSIMGKKVSVTSFDINKANEEILICGGDNGRINIFNRKTKKSLYKLNEHTGVITKILCHPVEDFIFSSSLDKTVKVWTCDQNGKYKNSTVTISSGHQDGVTGISLHPCGDYLISSSLDSSWGFFDVKTGYCLNLNKTKNRLYSIEFHPDGLIVGTGAENGILELWDGKGQKSIKAFNNIHKDTITSISFSENGYLMATVSNDMSLHVMDLRYFKNAFTMQYKAQAKSVAFDKSGVYVCVGEGNRSHVYQTKVWKNILTVQDHKDIISCVKFGNDANMLVSASYDKTVKFYE